MEQRVSARAPGGPSVGPVGVVGAGAVAGAVVARLALAGVPVVIVARRRQCAEGLAKELARGRDGVTVVGELAELEALPLIVLAVADAALVEVAGALAAALVAPRVVLHTSGSAGLDALAPLAARGHAVGVVHPLAALPPGGDGRPLASAWFGLAGGERALAAARALVAALRGPDATAAASADATAGTYGRELVLSTERGAATLYHAGASLVSGGVAAVLALAEGALVAAGAERGAARQALCALAATAVENVAARGAAAAVTGPAARGDVALVAAHLAQLPGEAATLYRALLPTLAALGHSRGTVDAAALARLERGGELGP